MSGLGTQGAQALKTAMGRVRKKRPTKAQALIRKAESKLNKGEEALKFQLKTMALCAHGSLIPSPELQFKFHPERGHMFDFAWPRSISSDANESFVGPSGFAIELDGGVHGIEEHRVRDLEKFNLAIAQGWTVFHFTPRQAESGLVIDFLLALFDSDPLNDPELILQRK